MLRIVSVVPVVLLALVVGCSDTTAPVSLSLNRARWERQNLHDYSYTGERFASVAPQGKVRVVVLSGAVNSATVIATGEQLPTAEWYTVDQLFDLAARSFAEKDRNVRVEFEPAFGYPTLIDVTCTMIADCGVRIEVKDLGPIPIVNASPI
jgi:uncharacterized protein DUF6174